MEARTTGPPIVRRRTVRASLPRSVVGFSLVKNFTRNVMRKREGLNGNGRSGERSTLCRSPRGEYPQSVGESPAPLVLIASQYFPAGVPAQKAGATHKSPEV